MKKLSESEISEIKENFEHFDSDNNGSISYSEFDQLMKALGAGEDDEARKAGFDVVDSDDNGEIDLQEFIDWWSDR